MGIVFDEHLKPLGLSEEAIRTDVELKLRMAGIPVLSGLAEASTTPGRPILSIVLFGTQQDAGGTSQLKTAIYSIDVEFYQKVRLVRWAMAYELSAITWSVGTFGVKKDTDAEIVRKIREFTKDLVDSFINAYLSVNPKGGGQ